MADHVFLEGIGKLFSEIAANIQALPTGGTPYAYLGDRIRELRKSKGMTLQELADVSGVAKSYIWDLEKGNSRRPSAAILDCIARALGSTVDQLLGNVTEAEGLDGVFVQLYLAQSDEVRARIRKVAMVLMDEAI
jgi:transcriptional regulator with XRE-family HTH domain